MKILFSGWHNPRFESITEYIERALLKLGHELEIFEYWQYIIPGRIRRRVPFLEKYDLSRINNKFLNIAKHFRPDMVFVLQGPTMLPETIETIRKTFKIPTVNWFIDYPTVFETAVDFAKHYDHFFVSSTNAMRKHHQLGNTNVRTLNFACDPDIQKILELTEEEKRKYGNDIVFVGSHYPEREKAISSIRDLDVGVWGPGWHSKPNPNLHKLFKNEHTDPSAWAKVFNASKIALNVNYGFDRLPDIDCNPGSTKLFEILGCGAFQLVDRKKAITDMFADGKDLVTFTDLPDMRNKIKYYLEHDKERKMIAANGRKEVLAKHTFEHRMREMLSIVFPS